VTLCGTVADCIHLMVVPISIVNDSKVKSVISETIVTGPAVAVGSDVCVSVGSGRRVAVGTDVGVFVGGWFGLIDYRGRFTCRSSLIRGNWL